jgi:hypothetical protein
MVSLAVQQVPSPFRVRVLSFALVVSALLVTGVRLAFAERGGEAAAEERAALEAQRERRRLRRGAGRRGAGRKRRNSLGSVGLVLAPTPTKRPGGTGAAASVEEQRLLREEARDTFAARELSPLFVAGEAKARSRSVDQLSVASHDSEGSQLDSSVEEGAAGGAGAATASRAMEEVCGQLQKQGDHFGLWKQRYFRLACLEPFQLEEVEGVKFKALNLEERSFVLLYWATDAATATSAKLRNKPRGAFLVTSESTVEEGESKLVLVLRGVVNAMDPLATVPPVRLCAANVRAAQMWAGALCFAALSRRLPPSTDRLRPAPLPDRCDSLGLASSAQGDAAFNLFFRLHRAHGGRAFLAGWDSEKQAHAKPITAQNLYDLSLASVKMTREQPQMLELHGVVDLMPLNTHPAKGRLFLKARSAEDALAWALAMVADPDRRRIELDALPLGSVAAAKAEGDKLRARLATEAKKKADVVVDEFIATPSQSTPSLSTPGLFTPALEDVVDELSMSDILALQQQQQQQRKQAEAFLGMDEVELGEEEEDILGRDSLGSLSSLDLGLALDEDANGGGKPTADAHRSSSADSSDTDSISSSTSSKINSNNYISSSPDEYDGGSLANLSEAQQLRLLGKISLGDDDAEDCAAYSSPKLSDYLDDEDAENQGYRINKSLDDGREPDDDTAPAVKRIQKGAARETWQSPRPYKLSPVREEDESRRSSASSAFALEAASVQQQHSNQAASWAARRINVETALQQLQQRKQR